MAYNLTEKQKDLARAIVKHLQDRSLNESFIVRDQGNRQLGFIDNDILVFKCPGDFGMLDALENASLLMLRKDPLHYRHCTVCGEIYKAVDTNFGEDKEHTTTSKHDMENEAELSDMQLAMSLIEKGHHNGEVILALVKRGNKPEAAMNLVEHFRKAVDQARGSQAGIQNKKTGSSRKRDKNLQRLLLLQVRDREDLPELSAYSEEQQTYNKSQLIKAGLAEGQEIADGSGFLAHAFLSAITPSGLDFLEETENTGESLMAVPSPSIAGALIGSRRVFLVHGHDERVRETVARFLEKLQLECVILHEQPNKGRTIIEKFEAYSGVAFAVVLLTPDDRGGPAECPYDQQKPRARQNVVLELGFFLGTLGRSRVCALYSEGVEIPSDCSGVLFIPFDSSGAWKTSLAKELSEAGINLDATLLLRA